MLVDVITYGFCISLAVGSIFAWANAETKYRAQRYKINELASQLQSAKTNLNSSQTHSGTSDYQSKRYHSALLKVGSIIETNRDATEIKSKIYNLLSGVTPEAVLTMRVPKAYQDKRGQKETQDMFLRMKKSIG